jgi:hypothetical protein
MQAFGCVDIVFPRSRHRHHRSSFSQRVGAFVATETAQRNQGRVCRAERRIIEAACCTAIALVTHNRRAISRIIAHKFTRPHTQDVSI